MTRGGAVGKQGMGDEQRQKLGSTAHFSLRMHVDISGARGWPAYGSCADARYDDDGGRICDGSGGGSGIDGDVQWQ